MHLHGGQLMGFCMQRLSNHPVFYKPEDFFPSTLLKYISAHLCGYLIVPEGGLSANSQKRITHNKKIVSFTHRECFGVRKFTYFGGLF